MAARREGRPLTLTERARREQLIGVTIETLARHGYAGTSLARIAEAAGISKAAVLYHFPSKDAVVQAAYGHVIESLTTYVGAAVDALAGAAALEAYIRALVGYAGDHPDHTRVITAAIGESAAVTDTPHSPGRTEAVAALVAAAVSTGDLRPDTDPRVTAIIVNGAVDGIVAEALLDPDFAAGPAAERLIAVLRRALASRPTAQYPS
jgi:AcrR family transcriptional regulator